MIGASIKRARLANCLSLQQLVDRMKDNGVPITKTTLFNYEAGSIIPSDNLLEIFGQVLGVNKNFFFHALPENFNIELTEELGSVDARRQELLAYIQIQLGQLTRIAETIGFDLTHRFLIRQPIEVRSVDDAEEAADRLRELIQLGIHPISSVCALLETHGYYVFTLPDTFHWKLVSGRIVDSGIHFIMASKEFYLDDFRFNLVRELGKNILCCPTSDKEAILDRFAASFLVPRKALLLEFGTTRSNIGYDELRCVKQKYGLSRTIIFSRLAQVGILSEKDAFLLRQRMVLNYHISRTSMTFTPLNFYEQPTVMYALTRRAISEGYIRSEEELDFATLIPLY